MSASQGALPDGWANADLASLADIVRGVTYRKPDASTSPASGLVPLLRATNIGHALKLDSDLVYVPEQYVSETQRLRAGDIVVATSSGSISVVGKSARLPTDWPGTFGAFCCVIRGREGVDPRYLAYFVLSQEVRQSWSRLARGTNINNLKIGDIGDTPVPVAPAEEQARIVAAIEEQFSRIDAGVESMESARCKLPRMRAGVLQAAVRGELVAQDSSDEHAEALRSRIREERRRLWGESLPRAAKKRRGTYREPSEPSVGAPFTLPVGWTWVTWDEVGFAQNGRAFPSREYAASGVRLLRPGNLHASGGVVWDTENTRHMPVRWTEVHPDLIVRSGELVMNLTAQSLKDEFLGRICMTGADEYCLLNQRLARLSPVLVSPRYLLWLFKSPLFRRFVDGLNKGSLIQHMFTSQLAQFCFPLPPLTEQDRIADAVEMHMSLIASVEQVINSNGTRARGLRNAVLHAAFRGGLAAQMPGDEPAPRVLARIQADSLRASAKRAAR